MKPATGIGLTALVLVATAMYLHSGGDVRKDPTAVPVGLGADANDPAGALSGTGHVEQRLELPGLAPGEPIRPHDAHIDQRTFSTVYQTASILAAATSSPTVTRSAFRELVTTLDTEVSAARARAKSPTEVQMVGLYADALVAYRDGLQFWDLRRFADRPGESDSLDALAAKYGIRPVRKISYTATWQGYPDAFLKIWAVGNAATAKGSTLYNR